MLDNVKLPCHSSIKIEGSKTMYVDPFMIDKDYSDADYIFCTHGHYDHFSEEDILKVMNEKTKIITVECTHGMARGLFQDENKIIIVEPNNEYEIDDIFIINYVFTTTFSDYIDNLERIK